MDVLDCRDLLANFSDLGDEEADEESLWVSAEISTRIETTCATAIAIAIAIVGATRIILTFSYLTKF